ncbi:phosphotransferase [Shewanella violacea]|nr:phosphotransferase [Shewanella violacea]
MQQSLLLNSLPQDVKAGLQSAGLVLSSSVSVAVLAEGLSNQNYLIRDRNSSWVLRVNSSASSHICDRDDEINNWKIAAEQGLAPDLYFVSDDKKYYLCEYIEQEEEHRWGKLIAAKSAHPLINESMQWPGAESALLLLLTQLTRLECPQNSLSVSRQWSIYQASMYDIWSQFCNDKSQDQACPKHIAWREKHLQLLSLRNDIRLWLDELDACALGEQYSHRDLNPHNLLFNNGRLQCIDFEYACSSHPLFDLAGVLSSHDLSTAQRHFLIDSYLDNHPKLTLDAKAALPAAINIYWVFAACWSLLMAADVEIDIEVEEVFGLPRDSSSQPGSQYLDCFSQFYSLILS